MVSLQEEKMIASLQTLTLPHHLVFEHILPRLPVKTLIRFKSVSKHWHSSISSPQFAKTHLQFSSSFQNFLIKSLTDFFLLPYDEHSSKELVQLDSQSIPPWRVFIIGCCNGLVCLHFRIDENGYFAVWNPATHQYRRIDYPDCKQVAVLYGFGYASLIDDFKIVAAFFCADDYKDDLYVFSLKTGNWKWVCRLEDYSIAETKDYNEGLFVDDALYWNFERLEDESSCILGFDLVSEQFKEVPKLNGVDDYSISTHAIKGCLAVGCDLDVWILKPNGDSNSWEKLFSIHPSLRGWYYHALSVTGKWLVKSSGQLKLIDPTQEGPRGNFIFGPMLNAVHYVEGLFSPFGTTKSDNKEETDLNN